MSNLTVIIPIHEFNSEIKPLFKNALDSVLKQKDDIELNVKIVYPSLIKRDVEKYIKEVYDQEDIGLVENKGNFDFQSQLNLGVKMSSTEYVSFCEYDDELNDVFASNFLKYSRLGYDAYLPTIIETDKNDTPTKITNVTPWSKQAVGNGKLGVITMDILKESSDFKINGMIIKREVYQDLSGLKSNIKLSFSYEFLLRLVNEGYKVYGIPKIMYKHYELREGSLFHGYLNTMSVKERGFWYDTAKKEYYFKMDREIDVSPITSS